MGVRPVDLIEGEFYHVFNRGTDKRPIFQDRADYSRFVRLLYISNTTKHINVRNILRSHSGLFEYDLKERLVAIGVYCLMPNHFHILLTPLVDDGVSRFMKKLCTGYSMYFNKRYERTGTLFEGPFKASWADNDNYLKYLYAYIHLNPMKLYTPRPEDRGSEESATDFLRSYQHSSLLDYLAMQRSESVILTPERFPEYFSTAADHWAELRDWLTYDPHPHEEN